MSFCSPPMEECSLNPPRSLMSISEQFLCCTPLKNFQWQDFFSEFSPDNYNGCQFLQDSLYKETVGHDLNVRFSLQRNYQQEFVKYIILTLEKNEIEVSESFYAKLHEFLSSPSPHSDFKFKHYKLPDGKFITLSESSAIISEGTTGLCSWQGAFVLAEWCLKNPDYVRSKRILELGSGIGLTGLVICFTSNPKYYLFTDIHESVLSQLCRNIKINCSNVDSGSSTAKNVCSVDKNVLLDISDNDRSIQVWKLDWSAPLLEEAFAMLDFPDVILAADVVYDPSLLLPLCSVVKLFLEKKKDIQVIFACTVRNSETHELFLSILGELGLTAEVVHYDWSPVFHYNVLGTMKLYSISKGGS